MKLRNRIEILKRLGNYLTENSADWQVQKQQASIHNTWFTLEFIDLAVNNIVEAFLSEEKLVQWTAQYPLEKIVSPKNIGIVMAGNIPLVGFHDFLSVFVSGHKQTIKLASKDEILMKHIIQLLYSWEPLTQSFVSIAPILKGCDAYIATGSNNSSRYFEYYFGKYPHIIRRNRTSVAIITGNETQEELENLSDDIHVYFGMGCRNVTKLYVPEDYDFVPLIGSFNKYSHFGDHHKYKNNFDYNLSIQIMNNRFYMTNNSTLLIKNESIFSPVSQVNYEFYTDKQALLADLNQHPDIQCMVGHKIPFGAAQQPRVEDYADGVDTLDFLVHL